MKQRIRKQSGFTLAELLFVVAVIAVLVGVAIPTLDNQLEKSRQMTDAANLRGAFAAARIAEINNTVTVDGHKIRIADKADDLKSGDEAYTLVFWCDTDTGTLYPSAYTLSDDAHTKVTAISGDPGTVGAKPESDTLGILASEQSCTTRLMARGTRLIPDHGALPFATHEYIRYRDRETAIAEQGPDNPVYELVGYMDRRVNHMRIRVEYEWSADMGGYTLKEIRFADITSVDERQ